MPKYPCVILGFTEASGLSACIIRKHCVRPSLSSIQRLLTSLTSERPSCGLQQPTPCTTRMTGRREPNQRGVVFRPPRRRANHTRPSHACGQCSVASFAEASPRQYSRARQCAATGESFLLVFAHPRNVTTFNSVGFSFLKKGAGSTGPGSYNPSLPKGKGALPELQAVPRLLSAFSLISFGVARSCEYVASSLQLLLLHALAWKCARQNSPSRSLTVLER